LLLVAALFEEKEKEKERVATELTTNIQPKTKTNIEKRGFGIVRRIQFDLIHYEEF